MHTGMLWFDNSQTALNIKIQKAVDYYHKKYGRTPDLCLVHPSMLEAHAAQSSGSSREFAAEILFFIIPSRPKRENPVYLGTCLLSNSLT